MSENLELFRTEIAEKKIGDIVCCKDSYKKVWLLYKNAPPNHLKNYKLKRKQLKKKRVKDVFKWDSTTFEEIYLIYAQNFVKEGERKNVISFEDEKKRLRQANQAREP